MRSAALTAHDVRATVEAIVRVQRADGSIPWFDGGQVDPWNHVEAAMALDVGGRTAEAERAYRWLARTQRDDGAWHAAYRDGAVIDATLDTNQCSYVCAGLWLHLCCDGNGGVVRELFPTVERALGFVLAMQDDRGTVWWARDAGGTPWRRGLVSGASSVHLSLACAAQLARALGCPHPEWDDARARLAASLRERPQDYDDKRRWAMDWYYPVLCGVVTGDRAAARIESRWDDFVVRDRGVRCVADRPWVTAAETCELVLTLVRSGDRERAAQLLDWAQHLRGDDAAYWTGANVTDGCIFPPDEQPTWTSAAVVLAHDAVNDGVIRSVFDATR